MEYAGFPFPHKADKITKGDWMILSTYFPLWDMQMARLNQAQT